MQFEAKYAKGIADGAQTLTFRRWTRAQAVSGHTYRTAAGRLFVEEVSIIEAGAITDAEAVRAGYQSAAALLADLRGTPDLAIYRVQFRVAAGPDPRDELAASGDISSAELVEITRKLERLDRASTNGPWTDATLELIGASPGVRAGDLAPELRQELLDFKLNVRKLKNLGLTTSLGTGYRLSPRGEALRNTRGTL